MLLLVVGQLGKRPYLSGAFTGIGKKLDKYLNLYRKSGGNKSEI